MGGPGSYLEQLGYDTYICVALVSIGTKSPNQMAKFAWPGVLSKLSMHDGNNQTYMMHTQTLPRQTC